MAHGRKTGGRSKGTPSSAVILLRTWQGLPWTECEPSLRGQMYEELVMKADLGLTWIARRLWTFQPGWMLFDIAREARGGVQ